MFNAVRRAFRKQLPFENRFIRISERVHASNSTLAELNQY
jgi:hypothetical protein